MTELAIIDSGGANIASLMYAFERLQTKATLTSNPTVIKEAMRVILPGVGAAKDAMTRLNQSGLVDVVRTLKQPVLGICLGMQLLCDGSEEEDVECLGIIPGIARKMSPRDDYPVPNMGWCSTKITSDHPIFDGVKDASYFYYLHSYALPVSENTIATTRHAEEFSAVIQHDNFIAAQFHPERSSMAGAQLLRNFLKVDA